MDEITRPNLTMDEFGARMRSLRDSFAFAHPAAVLGIWRDKGVDACRDAVGSTDRRVRQAANDLAVAIRGAVNPQAMVDGFEAWFLEHWPDQAPGTVSPDAEDVALAEDIATKFPPAERGRFVHYLAEKLRVRREAVLEQTLWAGIGELTSQERNALRINLNLMRARTKDGSLDEEDIPKLSWRETYAYAERMSLRDEFAIHAPAPPAWWCLSYTPAAPCPTTPALESFPLTTAQRSMVINVEMNQTLRRDVEGDPAVIECLDARGDAEKAQNEWLNERVRLAEVAWPYAWAALQLLERKRTMPEVTSGS